MQLESSTELPVFIIEYCTRFLLFGFSKAWRNRQRSSGRITSSDRKYNLQCKRNIYSQNAGGTNPENLENVLEYLRARALLVHCGWLSWSDDHETYLAQSSVMRPGSLACCRLPCIGACRRALQTELRQTNHAHQSLEWRCGSQWMAMVVSGLLYPSTTSRQVT